MAFYIKSLMISQLCLHQGDVSLSAVYKHHTVIQLVACSQTLFILFTDFQAQVIKITAGDLWTASAMGGGGEKRKSCFFLTLHAPSCSLALVLHCHEWAI